MGVDLQTNGKPTVGTFGIDDSSQVFASQSPLHEGRRYNVDPSGAKEALSGVERDAVGSLFCGNRVGPIDVASVRPVKERQLGLQFLEDFSNPSGRKPHALSDRLRSQGLLDPGQFIDDEVPYATMVGSHELEPRRVGLPIEHFASR